MTPVPCNFFSVANCDYRVGVELLAVHHLSQLLLFFSLFRHATVFNNGTAAVRLNSRVAETMFDTQWDFEHCWPVATDF